jgi:cell division protein FtsZ
MRAADMAISNPLLDDVSMKGAKGVLINITGGPDLMLFEVEQAANRIRAEVDPDANIIFGNTILDDMEGRIRVSVVATGIDAELMKLPEKKITPIRPTVKPAFTLESHRATPAATSANPVARQMEQLASELNATPAASADEAYILGGEDAPMVSSTSYPTTETVRATTDMPLAPQNLKKAEAEKKTGWGFFGRKRAAHDLREEPRPAVQPAARAPAPRAAPEEQPAPPPGEDLFPELSRDEQFEIPAFLRRQSN